MTITIDKDCFFILQEILIDPEYHMDDYIPGSVWECDNDPFWYDKCSVYKDILVIELHEYDSCSPRWKNIHLLPKYSALAGSEAFFLALGMELYRRCPNSLINLLSDSYYTTCCVSHGILHYDFTSVPEELREEFEFDDDNNLETIDWDAIRGWETHYSIQLKNGRFVKDVKDYEIRYTITVKSETFGIIDNQTEEININEIEKRGLDELNRYIDQENENLSRLDIDVQSEFDKAVSSDPIRSYIKVRFPGYEENTYKYICSGEVEAGYKVLVTGSKMNLVGTVEEVLECWPCDDNYSWVEFVQFVGKDENELLDLVRAKASDRPWEYVAEKKTTIKITRCNLRDSDIVIPSRIDGKKVTAIGELAFANQTWLKSVVIPEGVKTIEHGAFAGCTEMTSISIPDSVRSIESWCRYGEGAFYNCQSLTSIRLPEKLREICDLTFEDCSGLTSVIVPDRVKLIRNGAFMGCSGLTYFEISNEDVEFRASVFVGCKDLKCLTTRDGKELELPGGMLCI